MESNSVLLFFVAQIEMWKEFFFDGWMWLCVHVACLLLVLFY